MMELLKADQKYFNYATGLTMTNDKFHKLFGQKPRDPKTEKKLSFVWILLHLFKSNRRNNDQTCKWNSK